MKALILKMIKIESASKTLDNKPTYPKNIRVSHSLETPSSHCYKDGIITPSGVFTTVYLDYEAIIEKGIIMYYISISDTDYSNEWKINEELKTAKEIGLTEKPFNEYLKELKEEK